MSVKSLTLEVKDLAWKDLKYCVNVEKLTFKFDSSEVSRFYEVENDVTYDPKYYRYSFPNFEKNTKLSKVQHLTLIDYNYESGRHFEVFEVLNVILGEKNHLTSLEINIELSNIELDVTYENDENDDEVSQDEAYGNFSEYENNLIFEAFKNAPIQNLIVNYRGDDIFEGRADYYEFETLCSFLNGVYFNFSNKTSLQTFKLNYKYIESDEKDKTLINNLINVPNLKEITLPTPGVEFLEDMKVLLFNVPSLEKITIRDDRMMYRQGCGINASLDLFRYSINLKYLDISFTCISLSGLNAITKCLSLQCLKILWLPRFYDDMGGDMVQEKVSLFTLTNILLVSNLNRALELEIFVNKLEEPHSEELQTIRQTFSNFKITPILYYF